MGPCVVQLLIHQTNKLERFEIIALLLKPTSSARNKPKCLFATNTLAYRVAALIIFFAKVIARRRLRKNDDDKLNKNFKEFLIFFSRFKL